MYILCNSPLPPPCTRLLMSLAKSNRLPTPPEISSMMSKTLPSINKRIKNYRLESYGFLNHLAAQKQLLLQEFKFELTLEFVKRPF